MGGGDGGGGGGVNSIVGEIVERARPIASSSSGPRPEPPTGPAPPTGGAGLAFPAATHRSKGPFAGRKSKFILEREARAAAKSGGGGGGGAGADVAGAMAMAGAGAGATTVSTPGGATMTFVRATPVGNKAPDAEGTGIEEETARRLAAMSVSEIEEAQESLKSRLKPSALEFLKKRAAAKNGAGGGGGGGGGGSGAEQQQQQQQQQKSPPRSPSRGKPPKSTPKSPPRHAAASAAAAAAAAAADAAQRDKEKRTSAAAASSFFTGGAGGGAGGGAAGDVVGAAGGAGSHADVAAVRYTLEGAPLNADDQPAAARAASRLGSAVERDPLRAGFPGRELGGGILTS